MGGGGLSRRRFLSGAAGGALAAAVAPTLRSAPGALAAEGPLRRAHTPVKLGIASYSLRELPRAQAVEAIQSLGTPYVNIKSMHLPYEASPEALAAGRREFEDAGLEIVGGGTIYLQEEDDAHIRRHFEYARACGMPLMVIGPTVATLPRIERFVREYDIKVAIHNHGPEDPHFPGPQDALPVIEDMDPRVGVCVDAGHTARTGIDVADAVAMAGERLLDMHMKDLADLSDRESQCIVGQGAMPVARIFRELERMDYQGYVNLEFEIDAADPVPGMARSMDFMRGVLAGLHTE